MLRLLWLVPALPLAGFLALILGGSRLPRKAVTLVGVGSVGLAALFAILVSLSFMASSLRAYGLSFWTWLEVGGLRVSMGLYLDHLSTLMILVVTGVGFLIHLYSAEFMGGDEGYSRFLAYMNLFVGSMVILVLARNLLLLYMGWEGVGLCSYLLIGFWYRDPANGRAARKAFIVTRVGDTALAVGLFLLVTRLGTLDIQEVLTTARALWPVASGLALAPALLLLGGALGKSGQLPLQVWLPDAMAGPTPVSALIHAATMVTAGVYLIARTHTLFLLAPLAMEAVAIIGALTLLLAAFAALAQTDIKRILAYSTISQIGYMFMALGVGAWTAAMFHFMTHAFFKSLLFLGAGVVIMGLHHEHNIFKMGGLRRQLPLTFWTFLIGAASLAALPFVTAGFYSKDLILWRAWSSPLGSPWLWGAGLLGAFITALYTFRMVFVAFLGPPGPRVSQRPTAIIKVPLLILAALSLGAGFLELPHTMGEITLLSGFLDGALPVLPPLDDTPLEWTLALSAALVALVGVAIAYILYLRKPYVPDTMALAPGARHLHTLWARGWGFDWLYDILLVRPYERVARANKEDILDRLTTATARLNLALHGWLSRTQNGLLRWYAMAIVVGAIITIGLAVLL